VPSQYTKRRSKDLVEEVQEKIQELRTEAAKPAEYTQSGFDVYTSDGGRSYHVAELTYNPETGEAKVVEIFDISRLVALQYANQKTALNSLKRKAVKK
jgi:hypothetical protein